MREVHDLQIWGMSTTDAALTAHLVRPTAIDDDALLLDIYRELHARFRIDHATVQIERGHGLTDVSWRRLTWCSDGQDGATVPARRDERVDADTRRIEPNE